ncbi:hypothetical protein [Burkholderia perseverans]|uniref:hypothetical protein n=1 Tax=Burkholderia perseverans TaxID=2615214 RepID=UPI002467F0C7|nr:hypothetical protein [Burkholderia perseverans]
MPAPSRAQRCVRGGGRPDSRASSTNARTDAFDDFRDPNQVGLGVYDVHSSSIPTGQQIVGLVKKAAERLWINPDCSLKTRQWAEVIPGLINKVSAAKALRNQVR